ncbi:metalloregulator ArsR/SmtB family transcription factor [Alcanivorax sp.]|mgnify:FL=1|jgi:ArsR family transcriptional regulator|uniref:metalloregulator ArsR/SmtB family transcription factor n=1 Tax=Alcanivorax sp. TaxID=1872427 RepID=UPI0032D8BB1F
MITIDPDTLRDNALEASQLLKALSHPDRLMLLCRLAEGERSVSELEPLVGVYQPSLSQQLGILRREGLVNSRREGKQVFYQVANPDALAVLEVLYQRFCENANDH